VLPYSRSEVLIPCHRDHDRRPQHRVTVIMIEGPTPCRLHHDLRSQHRVTVIVIGGPNTVSPCSR
jgi:hypothetical protein